MRLRWFSWFITSISSSTISCRMSPTAVQGVSPDQATSTGTGCVRAPGTHRACHCHPPPWPCHLLVALWPGGAPPPQHQSDLVLGTLFPDHFGRQLEPCLLLRARVDFAKLAPGEGERERHQHHNSRPGCWGPLHCCPVLPTAPLLPEAPTHHGQRSPIDPEPLPKAGRQLGAVPGESRASSTLLGPLLTLPGCPWS